MAGLFDFVSGMGAKGILPYGAPDPNPLDANRNALLGYLAGALQGGNLGQSIGQGIGGFMQGGQADTALANQRAAQMAGIQYAAQSPDIDPALKAAMMTNPQLAAAYLTQRAKPAEFSFEKAGPYFGGFNKQTGRFGMQGVSPEFQKVGPGETGSYVAPGMPGGGGGILGMPTATPVLSGGPEKPPAGYDYVDPKNPAAGLQAIPGGPATHVPQESAGRMALMDQSLRDFQSARKELERPWGVGDRAMAAMGAGDIGRAQRVVRVGIEATLRAMTGAAAPESEVKQYQDLFMPGQLDSKATARQKLDLLENFMREARGSIMQGRGPAPSGSMVGKPGEQILGGGDWTDAPVPGVRFRQVR